MGALSFSDRLMQPYFASAQRHRQRVAPGDFAQRSVSEDVTWLFPVPWYSDELAWLMAEASAAQSMPMVSPASPARATMAAMPRASAAMAPMRSTPAARRSTPRPQAHTPAAAPRAFSPLVPLAAVSAAELVADLFSPAASMHERDALAAAVPELTILSASAWSPPQTRRQAATSRGRRAVSAAGPASMASTASTAEAAAVTAAPVAPATVAPAASEAIEDAPRSAATERARAVELLHEAARASDLGRTRFSAAPPVALSPGLTQLDDAVAAVRDIEAPLVRYVRAPATATALPTATGPAATAPTAAASRAESAPALAPLASPWVPRPWVPRSTVADVLASPPAVHAALAAAAARPRSLGHVAWADRWLARFAGAAPATVSTLSVAAAPDQVAAFESVFVAPFAEQRAPRRSPASIAQAPAPPSALVSTPTPTPSSQLPLDDEPVSDDVFAAISRGLAQDRKPGKWTSPEHRAAPAPRGPAPSALTQRALAAPAAWRGPGLAPGLGSSPVMPALSASIDAPLGPTFDVRALALTPAIAAAMAIESLPERTRVIESLSAYAPDPIYLSEPEGAPEAATATATGTASPAAPATSPATAPAFEPSFARAAAAQAAARAASSTSALVRRSPTPGAVGQMAKSFGIERSLAAADLSFDFVPPEVISAARVYGFDAHDAVRAIRLAESGDAPLAALKDAVAMTFIQAVSPSVSTTRPPRPSPAATAPALPALTDALAPTSAPAAFAPPPSSLAQAAAALPPSAAYGASQLVAPRRAHGATIWPEMALAHLGINARDVERQHPRVESALEVLAAGAVADAAVWVHAMEPGLDLEDAFAPAHAAFRHAGLAAAEPYAVEPVPAPQLSLPFFASPGDVAGHAVGAPEMVPIAAAYDPFPDRVAEPDAPASAAYDPFPDRALEPEPVELTPLALGEHAAPATGSAPAAGSPATGPELDVSSDGDVPWVRAAVSALPSAIRPAFESIYAALAGDPQTRALPPAERAARALAVARRSTGDQPMSARARAAMAWSVLPTVIAGGSPSEIAAMPAGFAGASTGAGRERAPGVYGSDTFGEELTPVTAAPRPAPRPQHYATPTASPALVRTGPSAAMYREAANRAASGERVAQAAMPTMSAIANTEGIPDWFLEAARHIAEEQAPSSSSSGISLAEMTLVTATPRASMAASPRTASASKPSGAAEPGAGGGDEGGGPDGDFDLDKAAHEIVRRLKDYFDIQRMRNGER